MQRKDLLASKGLLVKMELLANRVHQEHQVVVELQARMDCLGRLDMQAPLDLPGMMVLMVSVARMLKAQLESQDPRDQEEKMGPNPICNHCHRSQITSQNTWRRSPVL